MNRQAAENAINGLQAIPAGLGEADESCAVIKNAIAVLEKQQIDLEVFEGMGVLYEDEIARKDAAIAEQARQLQAALARVVEVTRERDAAVWDMFNVLVEDPDCGSVCRSCKHSSEVWDDKDDMMRHYCTFNTGDEEQCFWLRRGKWEWRGVCAENGGVKDD